MSCCGDMYFSETTTTADYIVGLSTVTSFCKQSISTLEQISYTVKV